MKQFVFKNDGRLHFSCSQFQLDWKAFWRLHSKQHSKTQKHIFFFFTLQMALQEPPDKEWPFSPLLPPPCRVSGSKSFGECVMRLKFCFNNFALQIMVLGTRSVKSTQLVKTNFKIVVCNFWLARKKSLIVTLCSSSITFIVISL